MTPDAFYSFLCELEKELRKPEIQDFFANLNQNLEENKAVCKKFVSLRQEVSALVGKMTIAKLDKIAEKLNELSAEIEGAVGEVQKEIILLNNAVAIVEALSVALGLAARIVALL